MLDANGAPEAMLTVADGLDALERGASVVSKPYVPTSNGVVEADAERNLRACRAVCRLLLLRTASLSATLIRVTSWKNWDGSSR